MILLYTYAYIYNVDVYEMGSKVANYTGTYTNIAREYTKILGVHISRNLDC